MTVQELTFDVSSPPLNELVVCPFEIYEQAPGLNQSKLKNILRSPRHFITRQDEDFKENEALRFGKVIHSALLEPEDFEKRKLVEPNVDGRTKEGKAAKADFYASVKADSIVCKESDLVAIAGMLETLSQHESAKWLLSTGHREVCIWWDDKDAGLCKARLDFLSTTIDEYTIIDLKTTEDAREPWFRSQVVKYDYAFQAAWYERALSKGLGKQAKVAFLAVEKTAPYEMTLYTAGQTVMDAGRKLVDQAIRQYTYCSIQGVWPGYTKDVVTLELYTKE